MDVVALEIEGVLLITPPRFADERGYFSEVWNARTFANAGIDETFVQDNQSLSRHEGTIRGLHFQSPPSAQGKLIRVLKGAIRDIAVDIRQGSPTFGRHVAMDLTAEEGRQMWIPPGFAHGFCTLVDDTEVHYKVTGYYDRECDTGIRFDDPDLGIDWGIPAAEAILSPKDRTLPGLADTPAYFSYGTASASA